MASSAEYVDFVCEQVGAFGVIRSKKMFGEYMVYLNEKPLLLICDNTVFIKMHSAVAELMQNAETGFPYTGAKAHYRLDIEDHALVAAVLPVLEAATPLPKPRKKRGS